MKNLVVSILVITFLGVCRQIEAQSKVDPTTIDIWTASKTGDIKAIKKLLATGMDINAKNQSGVTPLFVAVVYGQAEATGLLIEKGGDVNIKSNDNEETTALHVAAFFCYTRIVKLLLEKGADVNARNRRQETPLDVVSAPWSQVLEDIYKYLGIVLKIKLDLGKIKKTRPKIASILQQYINKKTSGMILRGSYARNGELHVGVFGQPDGKPLTTGHQDMKPSWSKTLDKLVFFRVTKFAPEVIDWKTAICVVNVDGTGFRKLTDGIHTDFNPTWTRDGTELVLLNRRNPKNGTFKVYMTTANSKPGDEYVVSDKHLSSYAYSCLIDGRIFVSCWNHPSGPGYFLMTPGRTGKIKYEKVNFAFNLNGFIDRVSISPSEKRVCYELQKGSGPYRYPGRILYYADFNIKSRTVSNPKAITDTNPNPNTMRLYPRWTRYENNIVYHCNKTGKNQLYMYHLKDGSTDRVSTDLNANYMFPHGEKTPK